jgi:hypothetical protein
VQHAIETFQLFCVGWARGWRSLSSTHTQPPPASCIGIYLGGLRALAHLCLDLKQHRGIEPFIKTLFPRRHFLRRLVARECFLLLVPRILPYTIRHNETPGHTTTTNITTGTSDLTGFPVQHGRTFSLLDWISSPSRDFRLHTQLPSADALKACRQSCRFLFCFIRSKLASSTSTPISVSERLAMLQARKSAFRESGPRWTCSVSLHYFSKDNERQRRTCGAFLTSGQKATETFRLS